MSRNLAVIIFLFLGCASGFCDDHETTVDFGRREFNINNDIELQPELTVGWDSGDALIADFGGSGSVGHISGGPDVVVVPEVKVAGNTIVPEVTRDTRSGLRLDMDYEGQAGVRLSAGMSVGGGGIGGSLNLGPTLTHPNDARVGVFYPLVGDYGVAGNLDVPNVPNINADMKLVLNGSAKGDVEVGLYPFTGYQVGEFDFNFPNINWDLFNFDFNFTAPNFSFLCDTLISEEVCEIYDNIPPSAEDTTLFRKTLPSTPTQSFAEIALANPSVTQVTEETEVDGHALVRTTTGDLARMGLDLDGIASYAISGVSFTGQELPIFDGDFATLKYDTVDVKYGVELGYKVEDRVDTILESEIHFLDKHGNPKEVIVRGEERPVTSITRRWDDLPEIALLDREDVTMRVDFVGLRREFSQTGSLTLSDYMELRVMDVSVSEDVVGLASISMGPLYYQKFDLAGEFAAFDIYTQPVTLTDLGLTDSIWDRSVDVTAAPAINTYFADISGDLSVSNLRRLDTHEQPENLEGSTIIIGTGSDSASDFEDIVPGHFTDQGLLTQVTSVWESTIPVDGVLPRRTEVEDYADQILRKTSIDGLSVPVGSSYTLPEHRIRQLKLPIVQNQGRITADGYLRIESDSILSIQGDGEILFATAGGVQAGLLFHGEGHAIVFQGRDAWTTGLRPDGKGSRLVRIDAPHFFDRDLEIQSRTIGADNQFVNQGAITSHDSQVRIHSPEIINDPTGLLAATSGGHLEVDLTDDGGPAGLVNFGRVTAQHDGTVSITANSITGASDLANPGRFIATNRGQINIRGVSELSKSLSFTAGPDSEVQFQRPMLVLDGLTQLNIEAAGTMMLSGIRRSGDVRIVNDGLLEIVHGLNSLRFYSPARPPDAPAVIDPIDIENRGVVRIYAGAEFELDANIVDYAEGGATFSGGTWELLGRNMRYSNIDGVADGGDTAELDIRISEILGASGRLADLIYEGTRNNGEAVNTSPINDFDTRLVVNDAHVTLSGAAKFEYFNTVRVNQGTLKLLNEHQFHTDNSYLNAGGETVVDSGAGLHVNGELVVNGGRVWFGEATEISIQGTTHGDGTKGHIEVRGGELTFQRGAFLDPDMISRNNPDGVLLKSGRSWVVSDNVTLDDRGNEIVTPGVIDFQIRSLNDQEGISVSSATVIIEGREARFPALEDHLTRQNGQLVLRHGKSFSTEVEQFVNQGNITLEGAQFRIAEGDFHNFGQLFVSQNSFLQAKRLVMHSADFDLHGVVDATSIEFNEHWLPLAVDMSGAWIIGDSIETSNGLFSTAGATVQAGEVRGQLFVDAGRFSPARAIGTAEITLGYDQSLDGTLLIEWDENEFDQVIVGGDASLAGQLEITLVNGFEPEIGTSIEFFRAQAIAGSLDPLLSVMGAVPDRALVVRQEADRLFLDVIGAQIGDYNSNNVLDAGDIDALSREVQANPQDHVFDVNADGQVDALDREYWILDLNQTYIGDANLDGSFDSDDFVLVFESGEYEDELVQNSGWRTGDWDGDREFTSGDIVAAFIGGGFNNLSPNPIIGVPEPKSAWPVVLSTFLLLTRFGMISSSRVQPV